MREKDVAGPPIVYVHGAATGESPNRRSNSMLASTACPSDTVMR